MIEADLSRQLHDEFGGTSASPDLRTRMLLVSRKAQQGMVQSSVPRGRRVLFATLTTACAVILVVGSIQLVTRHQRSSADAADLSDPVTACSDPRTPFARFWFITSGGDQSMYRGSVTVGKASVPSYSLYVSGAAAGTGVLCVSDGIGAKNPIQSVVKPLSGPIGYVGSVGGLLYFGVGPTVDSATVQYGGSAVETYSPGGKMEQQLQSIGNGWHVAATGYSWGSPRVIVRAFDATGKQVDIVEYAMSSGPDISSPAASS
jgi:hypothetical protein